MNSLKVAPTFSRLALALALGLLALVVLAPPASARVCDCPPALAPAFANNVSDEPAAPEPPPIGDMDIRIAPAPGEMPAPPQYPATTTPPKLAAESFGVGWPAVGAVAVALLAVLGMALMWRREPA